MEKERIKTIALGLIICLLVWNTIMIHGMKTELEDLRQKNVILQNNIHQMYGDVQDSITGQRGELEKLLKEEASLFAEKSVEYQLRDDKITVTVEARPKEVPADAQIMIEVSDGHNTYEQQLDDHYRTELMVEPSEQLQVTAFIRSPESVKQELLEEKELGEMFLCRVSAGWVNNDAEAADPDDVLLFLNLWINAYEDRLPFVVEDIKTAEFLVVNRGVSEAVPEGSARNSAWAGASTGSVDISAAAEVFAELEGERIPAYRLAESASSLSYRADLSEYAKQKDGIRYEVYFVLELKSGVNYVLNQNPAAEFALNESGSSYGTGEGQLVPIL